MTNEDFKEMYLLYRQKNMTMHDIRILYGLEKANEFEKEIIDRNEAINKDENVIKGRDVKIFDHRKGVDVTRDFINVDTSSESKLSGK